jgi:hypothetical protein
MPRAVENEGPATIQWQHTMPLSMIPQSYRLSKMTWRMGVVVFGGEYCPEKVPRLNAGKLAEAD